MKYILIDDCETDVYTSEHNTKEEAIKAGERDYNYLTDHDKKRRKGFYILESVNPDENAPNHFDGNEVKRWI